jgi:hypothetical protein
MGPAREDLPPADGSAAHARAVRSITADLESRAAELDAAVDALVDLVRGHDPVQLLTFLRILTSTTMWSDGDRLDDGDQTYSWDAKTEYLAGLLLAGPPGGDDVGEDVVEGRSNSRRMCSMRRRPDCFCGRSEREPQRTRLSIRSAT